MCIDWNGVFEEIVDQPAGASEGEIERFVETCLRPLDEAEIADVHESARPQTWKLPTGPIPESYLSLLRWSNGADVVNGDREIQFFPAVDTTHGVRTMLLAYEMPSKVPGILPFAFNGSGVFYAFDMRFHPIDGEYRIVAAECGGPHEPFPIAQTFLEACEGRRSIDEWWDENLEITRPMCEECAEYLVCPECGERGPTERASWSAD